MYLKKHVSLYTKKYFIPSLVEIWIVVVEKKLKVLNKFLDRCNLKSVQDRRAKQSFLVNVQLVDVAFEILNVTLVSMGSLSCPSCRDRGLTVCIPRVVWMIEVF